MSSREQDVVPGGPSQEEVKELNRLKPGQSKSKSKINAAANVLAASLTAVAGVGLAAMVEGALKSTPPARVEEVKPDPKRDIPPEGITFPQDTGRKDGGAVPRYTINLPIITKNYRELWPAEFGAPERGVTLFNRGAQKGVKIGDQQLFENLMYLRETYGRPDLRLEINFYNRLVDVKLSVWDATNKGQIPYDFYSGSVNIYDDDGNYLYTKYYEQKALLGVFRFRLRDDNILEFHLTLPETGPGVGPLDELQIEEIEKGLLTFIISDQFLTDETGSSRNTKRRFTEDRAALMDYRDHPTYTLKKNRRFEAAALRLVTRKP